MKNDLILVLEAFWVCTEAIKVQEQENKTEKHTNTCKSNKLRAKKMKKQLDDRYTD